MALSENKMLTPFPRGDITVERIGKKLVTQGQDHNGESHCHTAVESVTSILQRQISGPHSPPVRDVSAPLAVHDFMRNLEIQIPDTVAYLPQSGTNVSEMEKRIAFLEGKLSSLMSDMNANLQRQSDKTIELSLLKEDIKSSQQQQLHSTSTPDQISPQQLVSEHKTLLGQVTEYKLKAQEEAERSFSLEERIQSCHSSEESLRQELSRLSQSLDAKHCEYEELQTRMNAASKQLVAQEESNHDLQIQYNQLMHETEALRTQTLWYQSQYSEAVRSQEALNQKYEEVNQHLLQAALDKEELHTENSSLKVALLDLKEKVIEGKKRLIEQLQEIEEGMQQKDHQLCSLETERARMNCLLQEHKLQLEESKRQVDSAKLHSSSLQGNIVQLQSELEARAADLKQLQSEKLQLQSAIPEIQQEVAVRDMKLLDQLAEYNRQADELRKSSSHCDDLCGRLEALNLEKESLQVTLAEHCKTNAELECHLHSLQQKLTDAEITIQQLGQHIEERTSKLERLRIQNETLSRELDDANAQVVMKEEALSLLRQQFNELTLVKAKLSEENSFLSDELGSLRTRFEDVEMKMSGVVSANMLLEEQGRHKDALLSTSNNELVCMKDELASVSRELQHYTQQAAQYQQRILQLEQVQVEVATLQQTLLEAYSAKAFIEQQLEELHNSKRDVEASLEQRTHEYENQVADLRTNEESLRAEIQTLQNSHTNQLKEQALLHSEVLTKLSNQLNALSKDRDDLQKHSEILSQRLSESGAQLHSTTAVHERYVQEMQQRCDAYEQYVQQCRLLEVNLHQAYGQISGLQEYVSMLRNNATAVEEKLAKRETEFYRLKLDHDRQWNEVNAEKEALSLQLNTVQVALDSERQLKTSLQASIDNLHRQQSLLAQQLRDKTNQLTILQQTVEEKERLLSTWKSGHEAMEARMEELKKQVIVEKQQRGAVLLEKHQVEIEKKHVEERYSHLHSQWENMKLSLGQERETVISLHERLEAQKKLQEETVRKLSNALEAKSNRELSLMEEMGRLKSHNGQLSREVQAMKSALQRLVDTYQQQPEGSREAHQMLSHMNEFTTSVSMPTQYTSGQPALQKCIASLRKEIEELQSQTLSAVTKLESPTTQNQRNGRV